MDRLKERLPAVVVEPAINCASIQTGYVDFEEGTGKKLIALAQDDYGDWYMWAEIYASELVYRKRVVDSPADIDREKWDARRGIYEGGLQALNSDEREAKEELDKLQREYPDSNFDEVILGKAVELIDESQIVYYHNDYGVWMKLKTGSGVKSVVLLDGRKLDYSSKTLPKSRENVLSITL